MPDPVDRPGLTRRTFLHGGVGVTALALVAPTVLLTSCDIAFTSIYGPLLDPDANGWKLPAGFSSRVVATSGQVVEGTTYPWHGAPDGGAVFPQPDGGWVYVSNAEIAAPNGGAGMVRFASDGSIIDARSILTGTNRNCAGGPTPWSTWLSCEEVSRGAVWECDPLGVDAAVKHDPMGWFNHEAAVVDEARQCVYLTEDQPDSGLYRYTPTSWPDLAAGVLEVLTEDAGVLAWAAVPNPTPATTETSVRNQVALTKRFAGGEGAWALGGTLYFTTKYDNRIWAFDPVAMTVTVLYDDDTSTTPVLTGVDNLTGLEFTDLAGGPYEGTGDLYCAEDGGDMQVVLIEPGGRAGPIAQLPGVAGSELAGVAFSPSRDRLYVSSQRNPGQTFEISGPFRTVSV